MFAKDLGWKEIDQASAARGKETMKALNEVEKEEAEH